MLLLDDDDLLPESPEPDEIQLASRVGSDGLLAVDAAILSNATTRWSKVTRIVAQAMDAGGFAISDAAVDLHVRRVAELAAATRIDAKGDLRRPRWSEVRLPVHDVDEQEVVELLKRGHHGPLSEIEGTIARVRGHGPFVRISLPGPRIGGLKFQPPNHDRQCTLSSFFGDSASRFAEWLDSLDSVARNRHRVQIDLFATSNGKFELPPVYDFEGQVLDGGHRTRAAYYAHLQSGLPSSVSLDVVCDVAALP